MKHAILHHDTLHNTMKDVLHRFHRRGKEESHKKRKRESVNEKGCPLLAHPPTQFRRTPGRLQLHHWLYY